MSKTVYLYDENTGEFLHEYKAQESPLEEGVFLTPVYSTDIKLPEFDETTSNCKFINNDWVVSLKIVEEEILSKEEAQAKINADALAYLASTDWYVIRLAETGAAIPTEILAARQQARDSITTSL
jgi:hypothetical protein